MTDHIQGQRQHYAYQQSHPVQGADFEALDQKSTAESVPPADPNPQKPKLRTSCDGCQTAKLGCSQEKPTCRRCSRHGIQCVYSPFRRIGRPRKSTNTRPANGTNPPKPRSKKSSVDETAKPIKTEDLPDFNTDNSRISQFLDALPAPPSSPASVENGSDPWNPWPVDGSPLYNGLHRDFYNQNTMIDGGDPFSNTIDYLDMEPSLESPQMLMDCSLSSRDEPTIDFGTSLPTPPSSTSADMLGFGDPMPELSDVKGLNILLDSHAQLDSPLTSHSPLSTSTRNIPGLKLEPTFPSFSDLNAQRSKFPSFEPPPSVPPKAITFGSTPELTPPLSADSPPEQQSSCCQRCSSALIQQLASLENLLNSPNPSLDSILYKEKTAVFACKKSINCTSCTEKTSPSSCSILISMIIEHIMRLLEKIPTDDRVESCKLSIGAFEVDAETKMGIINQLVLSRLSGFAGLIREFAGVVEGVVEGAEEGEFDAGAAREKIRGVYRRLEGLKEVVEEGAE